MFAMFFGSGNLVFPLELGVITGSSYFMANIGFILTGVLVPFMGLLSVMLYDGDRKKYFGLLGERTSFALTLLLLSLLGPFAVVPRCILVAYGGIKTLYPEFSLILFSLIFTSAILLIISNKNNFIPIVGKILGPIKVITIGIIILAGIIYAPNLTVENNVISPFTIGLHEGYQTMDLPAAFFFSLTIMGYLKKIVSKKDDILKLGVYSSIVGGGLIAIIYLLFTYLGAHYRGSLHSSSPEEYLATITNMSLGRYAAIIFAATMLFACLTTASTLAKLFSEFLIEDILKNRISWMQTCIMTLGISFLLSLTGFAYIAGFLGKILSCLYPAIIVFTIGTVINYYRPFPYLKHIFWLVILYEVLFKTLI